MASLLSKIGVLVAHALLVVILLAIPVRAGSALAGIMFWLVLATVISGVFGLAPLGDLISWVKTRIFIAFLAAGPVSFELLRKSFISLSSRSFSGGVLASLMLGVWVSGVVSIGSWLRVGQFSGESLGGEAQPRPRLVVFVVAALSVAAVVWVLSLLFPVLRKL